MSLSYGQIKIQRPVVEKQSKVVSITAFPPISALNVAAVPMLPRDASVSFSVPRENDGFEPFFCALESKIRAKSGILCKFRLGSVQYVDALEGKSYFHAVANSQTTSKMMSVKRR